MTLPAWGAPGPPPGVVIHWEEDLPDSAWSDTHGSGILERKGPEQTRQREKAWGGRWRLRTSDQSFHAPCPCGATQDALDSFSKEL